MHTKQHHFIELSASESWKTDFLIWQIKAAMFSWLTRFSYFSFGGELFLWIWSLVWWDVMRSCSSHPNRGNLSIWGVVRWGGKLGADHHQLPNLEEKSPRSFPKYEICTISSLKKGRWQSIYIPLEGFQCWENDMMKYLWRQFQLW